LGIGALLILARAAAEAKYNKGSESYCPDAHETSRPSAGLRMPSMMNCHDLHPIHVFSPYCRHRRTTAYLNSMHP
jgi:hypothetical protein